MTSRHAATARDALEGLLCCAGCDLALSPVRIVGEPPANDCPSGCRRERLDAAEIERRVHAAAERHAPALVTGVLPECRADLYQELIVRVVVGAGPDDLAITWRA